MRSGAVALCLGLALCLLGAGFAATPLYVPGLALILMTAGAGVWVHLAARGARVVRSLGSAAVEEETTLGVTVNVVRRRLPLPGGDIRLWAGAGAHSVPSAADCALSANARFPRRGRHRLGPASLEIADPLGLHARTILSADDEVMVLPRIEAVRLVDLDGDPAILARHAMIASEAGAQEVDSLRPHRPGTPASRIHWPTVARTSALIERRLVDDGEQTPLVVVDPRHPSSAQALDQAMRAAASLCVHLARRGGCGLLLPGDRRPARITAELSGFREAHARLAMLGPEAGSPPLASLTGANVVLWVTAAPSATALVSGLPGRMRYLVSPHIDRGWPVSFTVAGCSGHRLDRRAKASSA